MARRGAAHRVQAGYVFVDGLSVGEVGDVVLRDRRALANDGMFLVVVTVDKQTGNLVGSPEIVTRGFVDGAGRSDHARRRRADRRARSRTPASTRARSASLKAQIKDGLSQLPLRADRAAADGLPGRRRGLGHGDRAAPEDHLAQRALDRSRARSRSASKRPRRRSSAVVAALAPGRRPARPGAPSRSSRCSCRRPGS